MNQALHYHFQRKNIRFLLYSIAFVIKLSKAQKYVNKRYLNTFYAQQVLLFPFALQITIYIL